MGLRKLTQWEETVAKQEQKQSRLMSVAIVCVIAMCAVLWLVQDKLYGDVVRTGAAAYGCSFIGVAIGLFVRSTTGETWATSSEKRKKFEMALIGIFIVLVIGGAIFLEEFRLAAVQLLCAYIPIFWILKKRKKFSIYNFTGIDTAFPYFFFVSLCLYLYFSHKTISFPF